MLDLNKNFLRVKISIVGADGAALTDDPPVVAPINYIAATFFKQIIVKLGDKRYTIQVAYILIKPTWKPS